MIFIFDQTTLKRHIVQHHISINDWRIAFQRTTTAFIRASEPYDS